jgi:Ser-tRNA(Ala) deacylase AlaX
MSSVREAVKKELRAREAEEPPLLEAVARERLVKTVGWKRLSGCCGDLRIVEISDSAVIACSSE